MMFHAEKERLCAQDVTLNGYPAQISGLERPFAMVRTYAAGDPRFVGEWAWQTAKDIVDQGGNFRL